MDDNNTKKKNEDLKDKELEKVSGGNKQNIDLDVDDTVKSDGSQGVCKWIETI